MIEPADLNNATNNVMATSIEVPATRPSFFNYNRPAVRKPLKKKPRLFPSSLVANTQRAEALFQRHYKEHTLERQAGRRTSYDVEEGKKEEVLEELVKEPQETRRATRSSGQNLDDWIKMPVTATVFVAQTGTYETLDGLVYLSVETARLFRKQNKVYFEADFNGTAYKFFIPDEQLPMLSEDHPAFKEECARIEEERVKKMAQAKHMLELSRANELATYEAERRCADTTLEIRKEELKSRIRDRIEDEIEDLQEDLELAQEEDVAIKKMEAMCGRPMPTVPSPARPTLNDKQHHEAQPTLEGGAGCPTQQSSSAAASSSSFNPGGLLPPLLVEEVNQSLGPQSCGSPFGEVQREPTPDPFSMVLDQEPMMDFDSIPLIDIEQALPGDMPPADETNNEYLTTTRTTTKGGGAQEGGDNMGGVFTLSSTDRGHAQKMSLVVEEENRKEGEEAGTTTGQGTMTTVEKVTPTTTSSKPPKRKINAADLAIRTLALASEINAGLKETGIVYDRDYDDIEEIVFDKMYPDEDYGEDEDLVIG